MSMAAAATLLAAIGSSFMPVRADSLRANLQFSAIPPSQAGATPTGVTSATQPIAFDFALLPRNRAQMESLAAAVSNPSSQEYGKYLTPAKFKAQFGPTDDQVTAVKAFVVAHGLTVDSVSLNNMIIRVHGTVGQVDEALGITLKDYRDAVNNRTYHAPDSEPTVDASIAPLLAGVVGLSNKAVPHMMLSPVTLPSVPVPAVHAGQPSLKRYAGPAGLYYTGHQGLSPNDTTKIYNLGGAQSAGYDGSGEVLGLFEEGTITASDITTWEKYYGIRHVPRTVVPIDGYNTSEAPGGASPEYALDVDMLEIWAHGASGLRVYDNTDQGITFSSFSTQLTDSFTAMATDSTLPDVISDSYGFSELDESTDDLLAEYDALANLELQGQSVFCLTQDQAAWTDESFGASDPNVCDPGSQVYVVAVGGTNLTDNSSEQYVSESSWYDPSDTQRGPLGTGGGGGVSQVWAIQSWQAGSFSTKTNPQGSTVARNVPDVSLYGDFDTGGYDIYITTGLGPNGVPGWNGFNGTSASTPLWAGFTAVVNQERLANDQPLIGFADPAIYAAAESSFYSSAFHDVNDGSNNGVYNAVDRYDNSTGWGSLNGANMLLPLAGIFVNSGAGGAEYGTQLLPFATVGQAADAAGVSPTTQVFITPGSYPEDITISAPVTLNDYGSGTVTIGTTPS
jgi:subtilase family serine protease